MSKKIFSKLILTAVCGLLLNACRQSDEQKIGENYNGTVQGTAYYHNYYGDTATPVPMPGQMVYIQYEEDAGTPQYIYADKTDTLGNFYFRALDVIRKYIVYTNPFIMSSPTFNVPYYGTESGIRPVTIPGSSSLKLIARYDSSGHSGLGFLNILTADKNGGAVGNSQIIVYHSAILAEADTGFLGTGSLSNSTTDVNGKALVSAGNAGKGDSLFIRSWKQISDSVKIRHIDTVTLQGPFTVKVLKMN